MTASELRSIWQQYPDIGGKTIQQISNAYDILPHTPEHVSYAHFVDGITRQYKYLKQLGFKVIPIDNSSPYETSLEMFADIRKGKLKVSIAGSPLAENHPLSYPSIDGLQMNVMFRAVHDVFGHYGHPHWQ